MLLATVTLLSLLLEGFYDKALSVGDMFECEIFFPKIFTKGLQVVTRDYKSFEYVYMIRKHE